MQFKDAVYYVVQNIPKGQVMTYGQVAAAAGRPRAARAVGNIMRTNVNPEIPCHRVVCSDGSPGGYNCINGPSKIALLRSEGIFIRDNKIILYGED